MEMVDKMRNSTTPGTLFEEPQAWATLKAGREDSRSASVDLLAFPGGLQTIGSVAVPPRTVGCIQVLVTI